MASAGRYAEVAEALRAPGFYPHRPERVDVRETHISFVFLAGERAYKLKKPLVLPYVDYGTRERRRDMCFEEVRLNRRLAPSIYLGVRAVAELDGELRLAEADHPAALEHVVEMRRFDEGSTLAARLARGEVTDAELDRVAARIAEFHAGAPAMTGADQLAQLQRAAAETFATLRDLGCPDTAGERFSRAFTAARGAKLRARAEAGLVRDGHGDLRADHVLLGAPEVEVVDCVEFDPALRALDVGADLSFLAMDLERAGAGRLARRLLRSYRAAGGDPGDDALVAFHAAHRARVRAKIMFLRAHQLEQSGSDGGEARAEGRELIALSRRLSWRARQPLVVIVCGLSGSGKSTLADELADASGVRAISSDPIRKRLVGIDPAEHARPEAYSEEMGRRTYEELGRAAAAELHAAGVAIVDATFRRAADRAAFAAAAGGASAHSMFVECVAPLELLLERAARRAREGGGPSDATPDVVRAQRFEPLAEVPSERRLALRSEGPVDELADAVEAWLDGALASR